MVGPRVTARQQHVVDQWAVWLYQRGYTTDQSAQALGFRSGSSISVMLQRLGVPARRGPGHKENLSFGLFEPEWRALRPPPGTALSEGTLNQGGLLTFALKTLRDRNALSVIARRVPDASPEALKEAADEIQQTIDKYEMLKRVLTDPDFAEVVAKDPSYRDDVGHRFR